MANLSVKVLFVNQGRRAQSNFSILAAREKNCTQQVMQLVVPGSREKSSST